MANKPNEILILFMVFMVPAVVAGTTSSPPQDQDSTPTPFQQMVDLLLESVPLGDDAAELNWTVRARSSSDTNGPAPKNLTELKQQCWVYFGHPQMIRDVKGFFRWGCQPYPITCAGVKALPKKCVANMFYLNKNIGAPQVKDLYNRCLMTRRPVDTKTIRYVSYCEDLIAFMQLRIALLTNLEGKGLTGEASTAGDVGLDMETTDQK